MSEVKRIAKIEVIKEGSPPDVDSDFNTEIRDLIYEHVGELYGHDNVCSVITFGKMAAKNAFKTMCTIYEVPFATANKIASLVPKPIEGVEMTLEDIYNPESARYAEADEFRAAVSGSEWTKIMEGALATEGRYKSTGMHAAGVIISAQDISDVVPLQIRQDDGRVITQWSYPECEKIGLIKFDFLGLDTVDLIQRTVEYIGKSGKEQPNMLEIMHGSMNQEKTYEVFQRGDTTGVFQFGSALVRDFCKLMKPDSFNDLVATTALLRPGPMGMNSHVKYANRKNGREKMEYIHDEFRGTVLEEILGNTYGLVVFQEQILQIANQIGGMTLTEGDALRKAMGKKKKELMATMQEKFVSGGIKNGYSEDALNALWDTMAEFARYGFNLAHSVAYGITAYECAYLKANYPVEFMSALIAQNVGKKDKILAFLKESRTMGIKMGAVDINLSDVLVAPDFTGESGFDILYGLSGVDAVSKDVASIIVQERRENGPYASVQNMVHRCMPLGISNRRVYENLALAGAFDCFNVPRRGVVDNIAAMLTEGKTKAKKGESLFDMFSGGGESDEVDAMEIDLIGSPEFPFVEKLQREANVIGLYLTNHPLRNVGIGLGQGSVLPLSRVMQMTQNTQVNIVGSVTDIEEKNGRMGKSIKLTIDDGSHYIEANLQRDLVKGIGKKNAQERAFKLFTNGETSIAPEILAAASNPEYIAIDSLEKNNIYLFNINYRPAYGEAPAGARINSVRPLRLSDEGLLPIRLRVRTKDGMEEQLRAKVAKFAELVSKKHPGNYPIYAGIFTEDDTQRVVNDGDYFSELQEMMREPVQGVISSRSKGKVRELPPFHGKRTEAITEQELADNIEYFDTGFRAAKSSEVEELLASKFGGERVDFGVFNDIMNDTES